MSSEQTLQPPTDMHGGRVTTWRWTVIYDTTTWDEPKKVLGWRIGGTYDTREEAEAGVAKWVDRIENKNYTTTANPRILEPTQEPPTFDTYEDAMEAAVFIPVTLYTADCPICGQDVMDGGDWSCSTSDYVADVLGEHIDYEHERLPRREELEEMVEPKA